jgi:hypothetical protein
MGRPTKFGWPDDPMYYLTKFKTTQRPRVCNRCTQNAYYYHPTYHYLCAAHLLDLVNIGEVAFKWSDYEEVWDRCERLLMRPPMERPKSTGVKSMESPYGMNAVENEDLWDGTSLMEMYEQE